MRQSMYTYMAALLRSSSLRCSTMLLPENCDSGADTEVEQSEVVASGSARSEGGARGGGSVRCVHSCSDKDATQHSYGMGWCSF